MKANNTVWKLEDYTLKYKCHSAAKGTTFKTTDLKTLSYCEKKKLSVAKVAWKQELHSVIQWKEKT